MNDFLWVEKYRPQTIEDCILPASVKQTFQSFIEQGEIPNLLLSGTAGVGKTTIAKAFAMNWEQITMLSMDLMKVDSWTLYAIRQRTLLVLCLSLLLVSTKFLSSMKQTIQRLMSNFYFALRLRSFRRTVDSSLLVTSRTRSLNRYIVGRLS